MRSDLGLPANFRFPTNQPALREKESVARPLHALWSPVAIQYIHRAEDLEHLELMRMASKTLKLEEEDVDCDLNRDVDDKYMIRPEYERLSEQVTFIVPPICLRHPEPFPSTSGDPSFVINT